MNPTYRFQLSAEGQTWPVRPVYGEDLSIDYEMESGQRFFRGKLSGPVTLVAADYSIVKNRPADTRFTLTVSISRDLGATWAEYWRGTFYKTDCEINEDDQTVRVRPEPEDAYKAVLDGMDKEFNLLDLTPEVNLVAMDKRPMIQIYVPGQTTIGCFLSGMWWEQECTAVGEDKDDDGNIILVEKYKFAKMKSFASLRITPMDGSLSPAMPEKVMWSGDTQNTRHFDFTTGGYRYLRFYGGTWDVIQIGTADGRGLWMNDRVGPGLDGVYEVVLSPMAGSSASGRISLLVETRAIYGRYVTDLEAAGSTTASPIPEDDIVQDNRNYHWCLGYNVPNTIWLSDSYSDTPTQWGLYSDGKYYTPAIPPSVGAGEAFPVARHSWGPVSIWYTFYSMDTVLERQWRKNFVLRDAFPLWSVLSVLLAKVAPGVTHQGTTDYSRFLYGLNPLLTYINVRLLLTPKSNIITADYDQPARKAPVTLKDILDMLRDCFRCYWFIDEQGRFRIEHIRWFMNGGTYTSSTPEIGVNLVDGYARNGKPWAFGTNRYRYDKQDMPSRYQFAWMDDVTQPFEGFPIEIKSGFVDESKVENVNVSKFTSDVDYIMLNPTGISKDGFALLAAEDRGGTNTASVTMPSSGSAFVPVGGGQFSFVEGNTYRVRCTTYPSRYSTVLYLDSAGLGPRVGIQDGETVEFSAWATSSVAYLLRTPRLAGVTFELTVEAPPSYVLPYMNFDYNGTAHVVQNPHAAFMLLERYYSYDLPAREYEINGQRFMANGIKRGKTQEVVFPSVMDVDLKKMIKTGLGNGEIHKLSVNLSSRKATATLKYDTE